MQNLKDTDFQNMRQILEDLDRASSSHEVCNCIVEDITKATGLKGCSIMLLTDDRKSLFHSAAFGLSDWFVKKGPVIPDDSITQTLKGKPITISDACNDDRVTYRKQIKEEGIASVLSVPVILKGNIIGLIRLYSSKMCNFNDDDISFVSIVAKFGALALDKVGYYTTLSKDYETFIQSMHQMRSELDYEWDAEPDVQIAIEKGPIISHGGYTWPAQTNL
jgi:signal transduction protein with GAF and PtsI domain